MPRIGIYSVDSTELGKPPARRQYEQKGLYDLEENQWSDSTDTRIHHVLPDGGEQPYSIEEIQDAIESATLHVYLENEVPGRVSRSSDTSTCFQSASD
jgi:hypothetical protein